MTRSTVDTILPGGICMTWFLIRAHVFSWGEICLIHIPTADTSPIICTICTIYGRSCFIGWGLYGTIYCRSCFTGWDLYDMALDSSTHVGFLPGDISL